MTVNVDWRSIRPLNGGRDNGFEELCSQLARSEVADCARFVRKGSPDAGNSHAASSRYSPRVNGRSPRAFSISRTCSRRV